LTVRDIKDCSEALPLLKDCPEALPPLKDCPEINNSPEKDTSRRKHPIEGGGGEGGRKRRSPGVSGSEYRPSSDDE